MDNNSKYTDPKESMLQVASTKYSKLPLDQLKEILNYMNTPKGEAFAKKTRKEELSSFNAKVIQTQKKLELTDSNITIDLIQEKVDLDFELEKGMIEEYIEFEENIVHHKEQINQGYVS